MHEHPQYDLHTHSHFSDGTTSVAEIAELVAAAGLAGFALTDHDSVRGWEEGRAAAASYGLDFIPGIELSTRENGVSSHILGYGFNPRDEKLLTALQQIRLMRVRRVQEIVAKLSCDYQISWESVQGVSASAETISRPHIADALISSGIVADRTVAFNTLLHPSSKYYVPLQELRTSTAVQLLRKAGGCVVLAHPAAFRNKTIVSREQLRSLREAGLAGIELRHPENDPQKLARVCEAATGLDLRITGASDFHGSGKPNRVGSYTTGGDTVAKLREQMLLPS
ncbi:PHP domain-containing protein [Canibacter sp. lx-72]|uniref:PHP domain-containing protein n=1 Tax=Canibacter zhuwentaonis TaxID=2837491 RepID=UPI001BDC1949|nr:PHP domain-containing protein [Canibacter zhuwentaonis]MBT1017812.1 PHP domain-containing protein [Canibacter zhuwentaonis]MBT1034975.1 PHP domain-containing protein [Canibacter zhuwentaonis]